MRQNSTTWVGDGVVVDGLRFEYEPHYDDGRLRVRLMHHSQLGGFEFLLSEAAEAEIIDRLRAYWRSNQVAANHDIGGEA